MKPTVILLGLLALTGPLRAQDHHAHDKLGTVVFATSCNQAVQPTINTAVALMHSFQFGRAIESFRSVLAQDPGCAMAEWGIALSSWSNPFAGFKSPAQIDQGLNAIERARAIGAKTERERGYIDAVAHLYVDAGRLDQSTRQSAYADAMASVSAKFPQDTEATIFYALALAAAADPSDKSYADQRKAGALLSGLFAKYPDHPGLAHYIIHAYDEPALASQAAEAARRYGDIAPATPHALHMPSHTFTRVGDWQSSIDTNAASATAAQAAGQPADVLHADDYMIYAYLQSGQDAAAKQLMQNAAETFRQFDPKKTTGAAPPSAAYFANAAIPARCFLELRDWKGAAALTPLASNYPYADSITFFAKGLGAAHAKDAVAARAAVASLAQLRDRLTQVNERYWAGQTEIQRLAVTAWLADAEGDPKAALAAMQAAAALEDKTQLASVTPGPITPVREMLAELLLNRGEPAAALVQYQATLAREPNRFWALYGAASAAQRTGDSPLARSYFEQLLDVAKRADKAGRPELAEAHAAAH